MAGLKERFERKITLQLMEKKGYANVMHVPKVVKVVINRGVGEAKENPKAIEISAKEMMSITGQKPLIINSRKAIAGFKLKGNIPIGMKVTLRKGRMYDFLDKLINVCLPKIRDFRGVASNAFDGRGNYTLGIKEQLVFPEIEYDKVDRVRGMDITIVTTAKSDSEARELLEGLGMPFRTEIDAGKEKK
jgi:large subunit ribosomal protein L5